jgi:DNA replication and repair protein RecF
MHLRRIHLTEFRSYHNLELIVPPPGLIAVGQNAAGKSSLLEAVRMLSTLRSPRSSQDRDVINWESGAELGVAPYSRVVGSIDAELGEIVIELGLQRSEEPGGPLRKVVRINQQPRRVLDAVGALKTVLFTPEDLELVSGSPQGRRRFMDLLIGQIDRIYVSELSAYINVTEQRNSLLKSFTRGSVSRHNAIEQLGFWDSQLAEHGSYVSAMRRIVIGRLCAAFTERSRLFTASAALTARYAPNLGDDFLRAGRADDELERVRAVALREFETLIKIRRDDELRRGMTVIGPHRDDLELLINDRSLSAFGSRGQQRLAVVALKLADADVISVLGERPVLLLDDVLSELDIDHRRTLLASVRDFGSQVLLTTADPTQVLGSPISDLELLRVVPGGVEPGG